MTQQQDVPFVDKYFDSHVDNAKIHYIEYVQTQQQQVLDLTIICIHGSYQTCHTFDDFATIYLQNHGDTVIYSMDLRGHGDSAHAKQYSLPLFASDVHQFIGMAPTQRVVVIGMSLGGLITLHAMQQQDLEKTVASKWRASVVVVRLLCCFTKIRTFHHLVYN